MAAVAKPRAAAPCLRKLLSIVNTALPIPVPTPTPTLIPHNVCSRAAWAWYSTNNRAARASAPAERPARKVAKNHRIMVTRTKNSFMRDGSFLMSPHVAEFFTRYDLEHDTANTQRMQSDSADMRTIRSRFGLVPSWTAKHLVDPYKLDIFAPRGHALQAQMMARLRERAETRPLWILTTFAPATQQTIRFTLGKRLRAALYLALEEKGYDMYGYKPDGTMIRGTLWLHAPEPIKAVNERKELFGPPMVRLLEEACGLTRSSKGTSSGRGPRDGNTRHAKPNKPRSAF
ncbi:hypothetical protein N3K66_000577 [Trichothecium roseum]|uniref:Uncharacterized protein n=1 Tax=Trichothecium roseum TaxID=47278 RepID=A0ACC0VD53_9HYPO|nr:hypothetical protein N3K66_000577 [Trichothecium roseum]